MTGISDRDDVYTNLNKADVMNEVGMIFIFDEYWWKLLDIG